MRFLIATLLALALGFLPVSGGAMATAMESGSTVAGPCHGMFAHQPTPDHSMKPDHPMKSDMGSSCAEHCMMQVSPPLALAPMAQPSIANAIGAERAPLIDTRARRAADPPETPPPRG